MRASWSNLGQWHIYMAVVALVTYVTVRSLGGDEVTALSILASVALLITLFKFFTSFEFETGIGTAAIFTAAVAGIIAVTTAPITLIFKVYMGLIVVLLITMSIIIMVDFRKKVVISRKSVWGFSGMQALALLIILLVDPRF